MLPWKRSTFYHFGYFYPHLQSNFCCSFKIQILLLGLLFPFWLLVLPLLSLSSFYHPYSVSAPRSHPTLSQRLPIYEEITALSWACTTQEMFLMWFSEYCLKKPLQQCIHGWVNFLLQMMNHSRSRNLLPRSIILGNVNIHTLKAVKRQANIYLIKNAFEGLHAISNVRF